MYYLLVLALVVCAHGSQVPEYLNAYSNFKLSAKTLETHLFDEHRKVAMEIFGKQLAARFEFSLISSHPSIAGGKPPNRNFEPNKEQVNHMVLKASLGLVADAEVFLNMKYEQAYEAAVLLGGVVGRLYPELVQRLAEVKLAKARRDTAKLMKIIEDQCYLRAELLTSSGSSVGGDAAGKCDEEVDAIVKKDKELKQEAELLLAISDLGYTYLTQHPELVDAAKKDKVDEYLEKEKKKNKPLVEQLAKVIELLFKLKIIYTLGD